MKRLSLILVAALAFSPIMAVGDLWNPQTRTQKNQLTPLEKVGAATVAATVVGLWGAGLIYLTYKMYLFENAHNDIYRQAVKTAYDRVESLIKSGVLEAVPSHMTPSKYCRKVINIAIWTGNKLTSHLPDEVIQVLRRGPGDLKGTALFPFIYLGITAGLGEFAQKAEEYFFTKSPDGLEE